MSDKFFKSFAKVGSIFLNTQINQKFSVISISDDKVTCRILSKLKRGQIKTPVEFTLNKRLFEDYTSIKGNAIVPTFLKVR